MLEFALGLADKDRALMLASTNLKVETKPDRSFVTATDRLQVMRFSILPQVLPVFLSNTLYFFESNVRSATILGVVGAGGIGFYLMDRILINAWPQVAFIILLILVTVAVIDTLSDQIRKRLI